MNLDNAVLQTSMFDKPLPIPATERDKAVIILDAMAERIDDDMEKYKRKARETSHNPAPGYCRYGIRHATSADIVNFELNISIKYDQSNNKHAAAFRGKEWVWLEHVSSKRLNSHGRMIGCYCLRQYEDIARADMAARAKQVRAA